MPRKSQVVPSQYELYFAIFVTILGLVGFIMAFGFSPLAKTLPIPVSLLLTLLGLIQLRHSWKQKMTFENNRKDMNKSNTMIPFYKNQLIMTIVCISIYPLLLTFLGFIVSSMLIMAYLMYLRGVRSGLTITTFSIITPILVYYLFSVVGGTNFPKGPWGF